MDDNKIDYNEINRQLKEYYEGTQEQAKAFQVKCEKAFEAKYVRLLAVCPAKCFSAKKRILIIGQENNGWSANAYTDIEESMKKTESFLEKGYRGFFCNFVKKISAAINGDSFKTLDSVVWTNIFAVSGTKEELVKTELKHKTIKIKPELVDEYIGFAWLKKEIEIIKPDIVLFLSGPDYDEYLKKIFPDLSFEKAHNNYTDKEWARLKGDGLPKNTFRFYHPNYANFKHNHLVEELVPKLADLVK